MLRAIYKNGPIYIFILVWSVVFLFYSLHLIPFHHAGPDSLLLLFSGIIAIILGYSTISLITINEKPYGIDIVLKNCYYDSRLLRNIVIVSFVLYILGGVYSMLTISKLSGGIAYYINNPWIIRQTVVGIQLNKISNVSPLYNIFGYCISIGMLGNIFGGSLLAIDSKRKVYAFLPVIGNVIVAMIFMRRYSFVSGMGFWLLSYIFTMVMYNINDIKKANKKIIKTVVILAIFVFAFNYLLIQVRNFYWPDVTKYFYESLYAYFTGNISSLDIWLNDPYKTVEHTFGQATFRDIFKWLTRLGLWPITEVKMIHQDFVDIGIGQDRLINTYTFVKVLFEDFGIFGILLFSYVWGMIAKIAARNYYQKPSYINLFTLVLMSFSLLMSFYSFYFRIILGITFWYLAIIAIDFYVKYSRDIFYVKD